MFEHIYGLSVPLSVLFAPESGVTEIIIDLLIQLAVILFAAKIAGELASRYLKLPPVLAELGVGVLIGPFALGAGATVLFGFDDGGGFSSPKALFMGAIMTATSVGITARVLADLNRHYSGRTTSTHSRHRDESLGERGWVKDCSF